MKHVGIIGCGYVGSELAKSLSEKGIVVTCTTRNKKKLPHLHKVAQTAVICKGSDEKELSLVIKDQDALVITVSAESQDDYKNAYLRTAQSLRHIALAKKSPKTLIYTSSTAVYGEQHGFWVDENSPLHPESEAAQILMETEETYLSLAKLGWRVCIFRLAEIYGPGRDLPSKVKDLENHVIPGKGDTFTNMIHLEDIVGATEYALTHRLEGVYNLSDDDHPLRRDLFDKLCSHHHLKPIVWDPHVTAKMARGNKRVSNHKIKAAGYVFKHPHRLFQSQPGHSRDVA